MPNLKKRRPDGKEWRDAEIMWASGDYTQSDIADKLGVSGQAVYQHMRTKKIEKGSMKDQLAEEASKKARDVMAEEMEKLVSDAMDSKKLAVKALLALQRLATQKVKEASDKKAPLATVHGEIKTILDLMKVQDFATFSIDRALGLDKENPMDDNLESLTFYDLTADDIEEIRRKQREELALINGQVSEEELEDVEVEE